MLVGQIKSVHHAVENVRGIIWELEHGKELESLHTSELKRLMSEGRLL